MNKIGWAVSMMRSGAKVTRKGWNGKNMYVFLVEDGVYEGGEFALTPFVAMKTADDKVVPWLCSQTDLLARDWMTYQPTSA